MEKKQKRSLMRTIILSILVIAIGYTIYATATKDEVDILKEGDDAPDFTLVDMNGVQHKLSDYKGKGVFLNFWGTWCKPCEKEMPAIENQYQVYKDQGVQVLAVNIAQSDFEVNKFIKQRNLHFPVVIDKTKSVMTQYNIDPLPTTILISPEGKIEKIYPGGLTEEQIAAFMELIKPE